MNPFSRYLVISQYFYFVYRDKIFTNTVHPYAQTVRSNNKLKSAKLQIMDLDLSDEQHFEICNVTESIKES